MLTTETTGVDAPRAVMWTVSRVAERDGVSKQAVSKKVRALAEKHGLSVNRDGQGRIVSFNVAEYDHLRGRFDDPSKSQAPAKTDTPASNQSETYDEAVRQKTWLEAEKRRLELAEIKGELVRVGKVTDAVVRSFEQINRIIDRLPSATDELAAAVAKDGGHGLRVALKNLSGRMRGDIADALETIAAGEPLQERDT